jgi:hypothetical protein
MTNSGRAERWYSALTMKFVGAAAFTVFSLAFAAAGCGENPVPERPTYEQHIKPLMQAHCIRCHGAGGTLNADPDIPPPAAKNDPRAAYVGSPHNSDFTALHSANGRLGLLFFTSENVGGAVLMKAALPFMPPPPADPLTDWELETLQTWLDNPRYDPQTP